MGELGCLCVGASVCLQGCVPARVLGNTVLCVDISVWESWGAVGVRACVPGCKPWGQSPGVCGFRNVGGGVYLEDTGVTGSQVQVCVTVWGAERGHLTCGERCCLFPKRLHLQESLST